MEERKLTKADIDKVRHIEGFPIGKDEDIIALSRPPYYTACPNPFIEDFIRENGTPYDEATDDYHREPFAADVSEGKNDPLYMAHGYHTKVPFKAIMRYILHYTEPGDIVLDGFCGSGMTGVAAQMCGCPDNATKHQLEQEMADSNIQWGYRYAILNDLSPAATFISSNYVMPQSASTFIERAHSIIEECVKECSWMYETVHVDECGKPIYGLTGKPIMGRINYTVWSDVFVCPSCSREIVFYNAAIDHTNGIVRDEFHCPHCDSVLSKRDCIRAQETKYDDLLGKTITVAKQVPVFISYSVGKKRFQKNIDKIDMNTLERIDATPIKYPIPVAELPYGYNTEQPKRSHGIFYVHQFYTRRNLLTIAKFLSLCGNDAIMRFMFTAINTNASKLYRYRTNGKGGNLSGTLYICSTPQENSVLQALERKVTDIEAICRDILPVAYTGCSSTTQLSTVLNDSIDYVFTDPPFGGNLNYSELSFLWEAWLGVITNNKCEAIMNSTQGKGLAEYQRLMEQCFIEYYRVLKPNRWITIEFHNSQNSVWAAIQEGLQRAGFIVADVRTLDKKQGSFKQVTSTAAVKQDLIISAYKPTAAFVRVFSERAGDPEMAWEFVRQHLRNVPVVADGNHDGKLDIIAERQDYLLFDRMVAWHIMNGIPVPMDAHTFYDGLRQRFLQRDGMYFLPDQVNEYDDKRAHMELDAQQLSFLVTDEKNAIAWLNYILGEGPKTYQEIQPAYLQELHQSKQEKMPELLDMLRENFVQDDKGAWYVPDLSNAADLAKVRRKALLKEFYDSCVPGKGKLKVFRMEAIRAGFDECWKQRDFKTIVSVGERLPEAVLQEDPALLMYYDNACSRV